MALQSVHREYYLLFMVWGLLVFGLRQCEGFGYSKPSNCALLECPAYEVVHSEAQFEIRAYKDAAWIAFPVPGSKSFKDASTKGFIQLLNYTKGINQEGRNLSLTAPILVDIGTPSGSSPYTVYYYLPQEFQDNPPNPISSLYQPVDLPPKRFAAVRRFGGFSNDKNIPRQASALKKCLKGTPWESAGMVELYSQAGYNAPHDRHSRVNEILIWFDY